MMKKGAKVWCFIVILTVVGLMFSGLIDTTSATSEKTTINVLDSSPWFIIGCHSNEKLWWWSHQYEGHDYIATYVGGRSRLGGSPSEPNCWARFKPYLSQSGEYEVYAYFYACKNTSTIVPFTVRYDGGRKTIKVDQYSSIPAWKEKSLGTWYFKAGVGTYVEVTDATGEPYDEKIGLTIGAIKFVKKETVPTPVISDIDPSQPTARPAKQWITIKGTSFVSDSTVTLRIGSSTYLILSDHTEFKSSTQIRVKVGLTDPGTWTARVTNPGNRLSNLFSFTVKQEIPSPVHGMAVTDVYTTPPSPNVGQSTTIHVTVTVKNEGSQQENYVPVKAYVDGYQVGSAQYVTLSDGKSTTKSFTWTPSTAKTYSVKGEVGIVSGETETSDNEKTISVSVQQQNLYWLAKAIMSEASVGRQEERIAVGWTVLNRLDSNDFPSTIKQVVESGYAHNQEPTQKIIDLSKDILERKYADPTGGATYFFSPISMKSGYGPYKIPETNKVSYIPSWTIPKGYSKTSPPHSDWEMTEFYKTIENLEWVSGLEDIRNWYFMFYRPISDSQEELIHSLIQQERIVEKDVPVTIEGNQYIIATLRHKIDPVALRAIPDSGEVKVYLDTEGNPVSDEEIARKIGIIDYVRHLQAGGLEEELFEKYDDVNKKMLVLGTIPLAEWPIEAIETIPRIIKVSTERLILELIKIVGKESVKYLLNKKEELRAEADMNFQSAWNEYFKACQVLRRNKEIVDYRTAYTVLENTLLGDFHEKMGSFICSKIYEPKLGKLFIREFAKVLTWGISEEALARIVHLDCIIESDYEGNMLQCHLSKEPYEFTSYTLELSQVSPTLSNEFNSCITEIKENTAKKDVADYLEMFSFKDCLSAIFKSPGELRVYDSQERVTGLVNGEIKEEIPHSIYDNESKIVVIFTPEDSYRYVIVGTGEGAYGLEVTSAEDGNATTFTATDIPISPNAIHQYTINWAALSQGEKGVTVKIDSDGDDVVEHIIITNNSFHPLIAEFTVSPGNPIIGEKVTLDASTSFDLGGGEIMKYRWEFYNAANQDPFYAIEGHDKEIIGYSFTSEGIYRVRLTVTDDEGEYSYTESSITIKEPIKEPVFYVPDDYPSIQAAVDAANAGDTIIVRDGIYTENVAVNKRLTIQSENGYKNCIVKAAKSNEHVFTVTEDYENISGFTVKGALTEWDYTSYGGSAGICLDHVNYCNISNNNVLNNHHGIHLRDSSHICITNNNVQLNKNDGIFLSTSSNNIIDNNNASLITLWWSSNNNVLTNNNATISLYFASNNILTNNKGSEINLRSYSNNNIANNNIIGAGISLDSCSTNSILTNTLGNGISIYGRNLSHFNTHIIKDNVINGKPIYYYKNIKGIKVTETGGQIILANCSNIIVENSSNGRIDLAYTNDSKISNNNVSKIEVRYSSNDTIANNNVCNGDGINIEYSSNNKIISNNVSNSSYGIFIGISSNNIIVNNIVNSSVNGGLTLDGSPDNVIYFNNFVGNGRNVCAYGLNNIWNSPAPITYTYKGTTYTNYLGNYWDDYTDVDTDNDGIWDNPYSINWDSLHSINSDQDHYPLMTWSEHYFPSPTIPTPPTAPPTSTLTPAPRPTLTLAPRPTLTLTPRPTLTLAPRPTPTLAPRPTPTLAPRPTLRPTATLFEKIEGLIAAIRVGSGI